ncbi:phosphatidylglycerophosphatase A family protein [Rhodovulum euryhalinum]|uniref:Phosphatidylglycerophosphatase A n=1 Tax=Rhodovulum euryhalinum TaxID=35805 RepID=A0A4R2KE80_9RHOB|nr:phosphatidylglycerophosphatase A [Rhodovulum euryhalinum]TCO71294.1 phosphatidylglycerophosphatase A [Rhodovulum euryhalinum]
MSPARFVATWFGVGLLRPASGTWGSLAALPLFWALHVLGGPWLAVAATLTVLAAGWWAIGAASPGAADPDLSEYVIDEVAGMWIALLPVSFGAAAAGVGILDLYPGWIAAFLGFRLFDIWKPGPIGWADRQKTALGVMLDDVLAGIATALVVLAMAAIWHILLM